MKVKDLIKELEKQDPEKEVMIQQGEDYDYAEAMLVEIQELVNMEDEEITAVVINF